MKFNKLNLTGPVQYVRFHPVTYTEMPCMQASVFGCSVGKRKEFCRMQGKRDSGIGESLLVESQILDFEIWITAQKSGIPVTIGTQNPSSTDKD